MFTFRRTFFSFFFKIHLRSLILHVKLHIKDNSLSPSYLRVIIDLLAFLITLVSEIWKKLLKDIFIKHSLQASKNLLLMLRQRTNISEFWLNFKTLNVFHSTLLPEAHSVLHSTRYNVLAAHKAVAFSKGCCPNTSKQETCCKVKIRAGKS